MPSLIYLLQVVPSRFLLLHPLLNLTLMISLYYFGASCCKDVLTPILSWVRTYMCGKQKCKVNIHSLNFEMEGVHCISMHVWSSGAIYTSIQLLKCFICGQLSTNASCINCLPNIICKIQHLRGKKTHTHHQYIAVMYIFPSTVGHDTFVARSLHVSAPPHHFVLEESKVTEEVEIY